MKHFLPVAWWLAATVVIALVLVSLGSSFTVPCCWARCSCRGCSPPVISCRSSRSGNPRQGIFDAVYLALGILCIEYLALMLAGRYILGAGVGQMPGLLLNPVFLLLIPGAFVAPEIMLENYLTARCPYDKTISFVSERRKITLDPAEILYVESNDSEVWLHTASGEAYRTKTRISQWESQLDRRFLRIHRSYIVNTAHVGEYHPSRVNVGGQEIEISRKYKDTARLRFESPAGE